MSVWTGEIQWMRRGLGGSYVEALQRLYGSRLHGEAAAKQLDKRTLTNLYNARPQWLTDAHAELDAAVAAAYGWSPDLTDEEALRKLLSLNLGARD